MTISRHKGFTLSELLISLAILGLIATFTIPKVLTAVGSSSNKAIGKEAASTIAQAYDAVKAENNGSVSSGSTFTAASIVGKINYAQALTSGSINSVNCDDTASSCYQLQNGAVIQVKATETFDSTDSTGAMVFNIDPDGISGSNTPISFVLGHDGRLMTGSQANSATAPFSSYKAKAVTSPDGLTAITTDPSWFSWN